MSPSGLDRIARELAAGEISRRSALKRLAAGGLGIGAATLPTGVAEAIGGGCPPGRVKCDGRCCPKNARCRDGRCKCKPGFKKCGRKCVDIGTSVKHCGGCGIRCAEGETCVGGVCLTLVCSPGQTQPCYSGPPGTQGVGVCQPGTQTCNETGTAYGLCVGEVTPSTEICDNGQDDDCDGLIDGADGADCCTPDCTGKACGDDGCGGSCGSCSGFQTCGGGGTPGACGCTPSCPPCRHGASIPNGCGGFCTSNCGNCCDCGPTGDLCCPGSLCP